MKRLVDAKAIRTEEIPRSAPTPDGALNYRGQTRFPVFEHLKVGEQEFCLGCRAEHDVVFLEVSQEAN